jgi:hypothetical protein
MIEPHLEELCLKIDNKSIIVVYREMTPHG